MEYFFQAKSCLMNHVPALFDPYVKKKKGLLILSLDETKPGMPHCFREWR